MIKYLKRKFHFYKLGEVFTPNTAANVTYVNRFVLEDTLDKELLQYGRPIIVYGHSGSGKTTLVRNRLKNKDLLPIFISCDHTTTLKQILLNAIDDLEVFYTEKKTRNYALSSSSKTEFFDFKSSITSENVSKKIVSPQITSQKLAKFLGQAKAVLVLDDFHKVANEEREKIADLIKVFIDEANEYPEVRVICLGAVDTPRELVQEDSDLYHRVTQLAVPLLTNDEVVQLIRKGTRALNIEMSQILIEKIKFYSNNIASLAHKMCYDICYANKIKKSRIRKINLDDSKFEIAIKSFIDENSDSFKKIYDLSTQDSLGWYILKTISTLSKPLEVNSIINRINNGKHTYGKDEIKNKLDLFISDKFKILRYDEISCRYTVSTPFWGAFLKMKLAIEQAEKNKLRNNNSNVALNLINQDDVASEVFRAFIDEILKLQKKRE